MLTSNSKSKIEKQIENKIKVRNEIKMNRVYYFQF